MEAVRRIRWSPQHRDILSKQHQKQKEREQAERGEKAKYLLCLDTKIAARVLYQRQKKLETNLTQDV